MEFTPLKNSGAGSGLHKVKHQVAQSSQSMMNALIYAAQSSIARRA